MSDKEMDKLPERTALGDKPKVKRKVAARTLVSGAVADLKGLLGRLRRKKWRRPTMPTTVRSVGS